MTLGLELSERHSVSLQMARVDKPQGFQISLQAVAHQDLALDFLGNPCSNLLKGRCLSPSALSHAPHIPSRYDLFICAGPSNLLILQ